MSDKVYVGKCANRTNKFNSNEVTIAFGPSDFEKLEAAKNEKGWVNLTLSTSREGNPYLTIWNSSNPYSKKQDQQEQDPGPLEQGDQGDLPF